MSMNAMQFGMSNGVHTRISPQVTSNNDNLCGGYSTRLCCWRGRTVLIPTNIIFREFTWRILSAQIFPQCTIHSNNTKNNYQIFNDTISNMQMHAYMFSDSVPHAPNTHSIWHPHMNIMHAHTYDTFMFNGKAIKPKTIIEIFCFAFPLY